MSIIMSADEQIKQIIKDNKVKDHNELNRLLLKNYTCKINQSTLSRKLNKLGIVKIDGYYKESALKVNSQILDIRLAQPNILVIHTIAGHANAIASSIDFALRQNNHTSKLDKYLQGTVAGDDTIVVITNGKTDLQIVKNLLNNFLK